MVLKNILNVVNNQYEIVFPMRLIRHSHDSIIESRLVRKGKAISNQYEILERIEFMKNYLIKKEFMNVCLNLNLDMFHIQLCHI